MKIDSNKFNKWLKDLNKRVEEDLKREKLDKEKVWTEEVIIPEIIFERLSSNEKKSWSLCKVGDIYNPDDIFTLFGVEPDKLNTCFSKTFYKLSSKDLEEWERIGKNIDTNLPINDVLIIFAQ